MKLIMTKGLPASGKSTFAKKEVDFQHGLYKRINKDDLRAMLDNGKWSKRNEEFILQVRDTLIVAALKEGYSVIVDDTNLAPKHETHLRELVKMIGQELKQEIEVLIQDFTNVSLEECISRDQKRPNYVGEKVIKQMYNQFLKPKPQVIKHRAELQPAIICDIDGTLALFGDANPYDRDFSKDKLNEAVANILAYTPVGYRRIIVSGRKDTYREVTFNWLISHGIRVDELYMRKADDNRKDSIVKQGIYDSFIKDKYNVEFVLDDRNQVVEMWRQNGLMCLQVSDGDF